MNENVIIADANFVDRVAFDLIVNFERMLERRIPQADMAHWAECVALDGGLRNGEHQTVVILTHDKSQTEMKNFAPGRFEDLNGMAFKGNLGEFSFSTPNGEGFVDKDELFLDTLQTVLQQESVKRVSIMDMLGKEVMNVENCSGNTVNIANLPAGMYVVRVQSQSGKVYSAKLVKK